MKTADLLILVYFLPLILLWTIWSWRKRKKSAVALAVLKDNVSAGLDQPVSLHPIIDPVQCLGCGACVNACPEKSILALIDGKGVLIEPTMCVGHGACDAACPFDAITLVFGTATRGVEIPMLSPDFQTSVPGIYIAGELGGMGLVKNAINQGRQAIEALAERAAGIPDAPGLLDAVIVGCGPAGISASLGALERKLAFVTVDQSDIGGTVAHYPRGKMVMTAPAELPMVGRIEFGEIQKEDLVGFWEKVVADAGLEIRSGEEVKSVVAEGPGFLVRTSKEEYRAKCVLLAIGRRGTPRTLGVPGEELSKVVYRMIDPAQYAGCKVLVVGGGDSALEAAAEIAEQPGSKVTLSYRGKAYARARAKNRDRVAALVDKGMIDERLESEVVRIDKDSAELTQGGASERIANDAVIVCAGGILPTGFLKEIGIEVETKYGTR